MGIKGFSETEWNSHEKDGGYRVCSRCVMDTTAKGIKFDDKGECSFCKLHDKLEDLYPLGKEGQKHLEDLIKKAKEQGKNKKYDCVIGVSGGRDSSYLLYKAVKEWGLRPLAVHFNDGFDNPVAGENIKKAVRKLGVELRTITSDWRESKDIRIAFLKASVPNLEVGTDMGIMATLFGVACKENCEYIFTAHSFRTEGIAPLTWSYLDARYLKSVLDKFGTVKLRKWRPNDPGYTLNFLALCYYMFIKRIKSVTPLFHVDYVRRDVDDILKRELEWTNTGAHYFDDLWQSLLHYVYRVKFKADKRKFNYSALVRSGQMNRNEALKKVKEIYVIEDPKVIDLCVKRLGITHKDLDEFISYPPKTFLDYPTYYGLIKWLKFPIKIASKMHIIPAGTYDKLFNCI